MTLQPSLIRPDRNAMIVILISLTGFILLVSLKIHYSSINQLNEVFVQKPTPESNHGTLLGTPKKIRSDEWFVATPTIISQYNKGFPVKNPAVGAAGSPLVMNIPVYHFSALFMPQNWGFFILPLDYAFSFLWNYRVIGLFLSTFLVLLLLTGNQTWLSLTGSLLLLFSPFIQWWFSSYPGEYIIAMNVIILASLNIVFSVRIFSIILSSILLTIFSLNLLLIPYPPFQVPIFYLIVILFAGFLITRFNRERISTHFLIKVMAAAASFLLIAAVSLLFLRDIKETMDIVLNTSYPGKRFSTGGTLSPLRMFSGFFDIFLSEKRYLWSNICETSTFILLFPFLIPVIFPGAFRKKN